MKSAYGFIVEIFKSKSFGFLALLFVVGTIALLVGKLASHEWVELCKWLGLGGAARSAAGDFSTQKKQIDTTEKQLENITANKSDSAIAADVVHSTGQ